MPWPRVAARAARTRRGAESAASAARVEAHQLLGDADRLLAALALEGLRDLHLDPARDVVDALEGRAHAHARVDRQGRREADAVVAVVDAEREALDGVGLVGEAGAEGERVQAVGDGRAEGRLGRALGVDVDPLVVA